VVPETAETGTVEVKFTDCEALLTVIAKFDDVAAL
jgi:hypothetical protein